MLRGSFGTLRLFSRQTVTRPILLSALASPSIQPHAAQLESLYTSDVADLDRMMRESGAKLVQIPKR